MLIWGERAATAALCIALVGCGGESADEPDSGVVPGIGDGNAETSVGDTGTEPGQETDGGEDTGGGETMGDPPATSGGAPLFDLGGGDVTGTTPMAGCQAVDFLFVIDNSVSMENEQEALVGAFPGFMDAIENVLEVGSDYHIMVLDTDAWGRCDTANPWDGATPGSGTCNDYIEQTTFDECDRVRGAGVLHPAGELASNMLCTPASGKRYIEPGEPDLAGTFACMATVGTAGHASERPMNAIEHALDATNAESQACNAGFLRDDALLVVTFVSDDGGQPDEGEPQYWYDAVLAAKGGDPSGVVVLGLGPGGPGCGGGGEHWLDFVEMWGDNGIHGGVCGTAEEYVQFFQDAVTTIDQACEDYDPPG
ncbi:MAG: hypothetical protein AAF721_05085 [Myxococcota bacterium]